MINSSERSDILVFNCYLCHVRFLLTYYVCSTKIGEISDISNCFENFVSQTLGVLTRIYAAELRDLKTHINLGSDLALLLGLKCDLSVTLSLKPITNFITNAAEYISNVLGLIAPKDGIVLTGSSAVIIGG